MQLPSARLSPSSENKKKTLKKISYIFSQKTFLIFQEMKFPYNF